MKARNEGQAHGQRAQPFLRDLLTGLGMLAVAFIADVLSGPEVNTAMIYVLPVALAAVERGLWGGLAMALLANVLSLSVALNQGGAPVLLMYGNALLALGVEGAIVYGLAQLHMIEEAREEMVQFVAHDLRTPLGNILIGLDILLIQPRLQDDPALRHLVEMCQTSAQRLQHLVNSMLDLAKLENGQFQVNLQPLAIDEVLNGVVEQMTLWADQARVTLQVDQEKADALLLNRVLINLVGNAIKYSRPESVVVVRVRPEGTRVRFEVQDHGAGIPLHLLTRVFDRFYQVEARRAGQATGSGLGLTFCRAAILALQGHIHLESEVGRGTTVIFTLQGTESWD